MRFIDIKHKAYFVSGVPHVIWCPDLIPAGIYHTFSMIAELEDGESCNVTIPDSQNVFRLYKDAGTDNLQDHLTYSNNYSTQTINSKQYAQIIFVICANNEADYIESFYINDNEYKIGAQIREKSEFLETNLINKGIELPDSIYSALYDSDPNDLENVDYVLLNNKYKELLQNYMDVIANKGSYKSLINSLQWFGYRVVTNNEYGYTDLIELREVWKHNTEDGEKFSEHKLSQMIINEFKENLAVYSKTTYFVIVHDVENFPYDNDYLLNIINDETNPSDLLAICKWTKSEMRSKLYLLGLYFERFFMPVHLDLLRSSVEDTYRDTLTLSYGSCDYVTDLVTYGELKGSLEYDDVSKEGGILNPELKYSQTKTVGDSEETINEASLNEDILIKWTIDNGATIDDQGIVTIPENLDYFDKTYTVTCTIVLNGSILVLEASINQEANTKTIEYAIEFINLSYPETDTTDKGTTVNPELTYKLYKYIDGSKYRVHDDAQVSYSISSGTIDETTGGVNVGMKTKINYIITCTITYENVTSTVTASFRTYYTDYELAGNLVWTGMDGESYTSNITSIRNYSSNPCVYVAVEQGATIDFRKLYVDHQKHYADSTESIEMYGINISYSWNTVTNGFDPTDFDVDESSNILTISKIKTDMFEHMKKTENGNFSYHNINIPCTYGLNQKTIKTFYIYFVNKYVFYSTRTNVSGIGGFLCNGYNETIVLPEGPYDNWDMFNSYVLTWTSQYKKSLNTGYYESITDSQDESLYITSTSKNGIWRYNCDPDPATNGGYLHHGEPLYLGLESYADDIKIIQNNTGYWIIVRYVDP